MNRAHDIVWHPSTVSRSGRGELNGHRSALVWFTGLSASGKSTLAHGVEERLHRLRYRTFVLDGDNVRHGLCCDLGFSDEDRVENIRRVGEVGKLFLEAGVITLGAFISPFEAERERIRSLFPPGDFLEVYCRCPMETCELRDVKGLYKRARLGEISHFTGISSTYEEPSDPDLVVETDRLSVDSSIELVLSLLRDRGVIRADQTKN